MSLNATQEPPRQLAVFVDGDGMSAINQQVDSKEQLAFLDQQTSAAVYHLTTPSHLLVLGAGTGNDILQARYNNVINIDAVELNPQMTELMMVDYADFSGNLFNQPGIKLHIQDARGFITNASRQFDTIQIALLDAHSASSSGLYALSENYLYTVEAIKEYITHLQPNGYLSITRWIKLPPRDSLKLFTTLAQDDGNLHRQGTECPGKHFESGRASNAYIAGQGALPRLNSVASGFLMSHIILAFNLLKPTNLTSYGNRSFTRQPHRYLALMQVNSSNNINLT